MQFEDSNNYGALSPEALSDFIQSTKMNLPNDYQQYLLKYNGGKPVPSDFHISNEQGISGIHVMYGLNDGPDWQSLRDCFFVFQGRMPSSVLPVGSDHFGNQIVISCAGGHRGSVWFWDHEQEAPWYRKWSNMIRIANSWTDYLATLFEFIDPNETEWEKMIRTHDISALHQYIADNNDLNITDKFNNTLIENCAIAAADEFIVTLSRAGSVMGRSLEFAERNVKYGSEQHKKTVEIIQSLLH